jgi:hypothetical protein
MLVPVVHPEHPVIALFEHPEVAKLRDRAGRDGRAAPGLVRDVLRLGG